MKTYLPRFKLRHDDPYNFFNTLEKFIHKGLGRTRLNEE